MGEGGGGGIFEWSERGKERRIKETDVRIIMERRRNESREEKRNKKETKKRREERGEERREVKKIGFGEERTIKKGREVKETKRVKTTNKVSRQKKGIRDIMQADGR